VALSTSTPITATVRVPRVASKAARGDRGDVFELIKVEQVQVRWQHDLGLDRMRREDSGVGGRIQRAPYHPARGSLERTEGVDRPAVVIRKAPSSSHGNDPALSVPICLHLLVTRIHRHHRPPLPLCPRRCKRRSSPPPPSAAAPARRPPPPLPPPAAPARAPRRRRRRAGCRTGPGPRWRPGRGARRSWGAFRGSACARGVAARASLHVRSQRVKSLHVRSLYMRSLHVRCRCTCDCFALSDPWIRCWRHANLYAHWICAYNGLSLFITLSKRLPTFSRALLYEDLFLV
jgi:hypothetical protein